MRSADPEREAVQVASSERQEAMQDARRSSRVGRTKRSPQRQLSPQATNR
jgi:hypothetical protein